MKKQRRPQTPKGRNQEFAMMTVTRHARSAQAETPKNRYNRNEQRRQAQRGQWS